MKLEKINKFFKIIAFYLLLFFSFDIVYSNFFYKSDLKYNCYKYTNNFHFLQKNCKAKEKWIKKAVAYNVFTDENGFRFSGLKKEISKNNALFFGDSFTYGMGLEYNKTFVGIIENEISSYNIINFGVQGYSPSVYLYQLKKFKDGNNNAKKIFVTLDLSDVFEEASIWKNDKNYDHPILRNERNLNEDEKKLSFKDKNFKASRFIARKINNFFRKLRLSNYNSSNLKKIPGNSGWGNFIFTELSETDQSLWHPIGFEAAIKKIDNNFLSIGKIASQMKADFYIIIYPWPDTIYNGQKKFNWEKYSSNLCKISNCKKLINLFPDFNNIRKNNANWLNKLFIAGDLHITPFGQKLISKKIIQEGFNE